VIVAKLSDYLPLADLGKILLACLVVAVVAPSAAAVAITGLDRRERGRSSGALGLSAIGVAVLLALVAAGIYALAEK
jgi:hypothetical protein